MENGKFELELTVADSLAAKVRWIQVYVHTEPTGDGKWHDGVGVQAVRLVEDEKN